MSMHLTDHMYAASIELSSGVLFPKVDAGFSLPANQNTIRSAHDFLHHAFPIDLVYGFRQSQQPKLLSQDRVVSFLFLLKIYSNGPFKGYEYNMQEVRGRQAFTF